MYYEAVIYAAVLLFGLVIVFYCVCILCDEHLVPAIEVFIEQFEVPEEVAAVTFVAFGSACPEIVLNTIGALENKSSLSLPACLGSAIIAFGLIPALCVICNANSDSVDETPNRGGSPTRADGAMELKIVPIVRETFFYCTALLIFLGAFSNGSVSTGEALLLVSVYFAYVALVVGLYFRRRWAAAQIVATGDTSPKASPLHKHVHHEQGSSTILTSVAHLSIEGENAGSQVNGGGVDAGIISAAADEGGSPFQSLRAALLQSIASMRRMLDSAIGLPIHDALQVVMPRLHTSTPVSVPSSPTAAGLTVQITAVPLWRAVLVLVCCIAGVGLLSSCIIVLCTEFTTVLGVSSGTIGATMVALGSEIPDTVQSITLARNGYHEAAMAGAIGSQVINLSLGGGLPLLFLTLNNARGEFVLSQESTSSLWLLASLLLCLICVHVCLILPMKKIAARLYESYISHRSLAPGEEQEEEHLLEQGRTAENRSPTAATAGGYLHSCVAALAATADSFEYTQFTVFSARWLLFSWCVVFVAFIFFNEDVV